MSTTPTRFDWHDGERRVHFGRGRLEEAADLVGGPGFTLLTTARAAREAPALTQAAATVHEVGPGLVDELAGDLLASVEGDRLVALGGGRVIDVTKALVAARGGRAMAVPTTLSGAEMTPAHRQARGGPDGAPQVRPSVVVADPALMASQPVAEIAASALNALGHAVEGPCTVRSNPVATLAGDEAARLIVGAFRRADQPDRDVLALGALLAGYAIDSAGYGLHHVVCQTLVRLAGVPHAAANAIMLEHTVAALRRRFPERIGAAGEAAGEDVAAAARRMCAITGTTRLSEHGVQMAALERAADAAARRPQLDLTPPRPDRDEILALYQRAL